MKFYNPYFYATVIECILHKHTLAPMGSDGEIERNPIAFIDVALNVYEGQNDKKQIRDIPFWDKCKHFKGTPMSSINEDAVQELVKDFSPLLG